MKFERTITLLQIAGLLDEEPVRPLAREKREKMAAQR
jgi:hypothetical protein